MMSWRDFSGLVDIDPILLTSNSDKKCLYVKIMFVLTVNEVLEGLPHMTLSHLPSESLPP